MAATLYADTGSLPIRIRNMSRSGALIESAVLPELGEKISVKRGQLQAAGRIVWRSGRRAGVSFEAAVHVSDWMKRQMSEGQERVDAMMASLKQGDTGPDGSSANRPSVTGELTMLRFELEEMGRLLIADAILVATHPEIQAIDISLQRIDRILLLMRAQGKASPG